LGVRSGRYRSEALGGERLEHLADDGDPLGAEPLFPFMLEVVDQPAADRLRFAPALGQADDLRATVGRIGNPLDVAEPLKVGRDRLANQTCRLSLNSRTFCVDN
jgi:hypothetical protein